MQLPLAQDPSARSIAEKGIAHQRDRQWGGFRGRAAAGQKHFTLPRFYPALFTFLSTQSIDLGP